MRNDDQAKGNHTGFETTKPADIAEVVYAVITLPGNINANEIEVMPLMQAFGPRVFRQDGA